MLRRNFIASLAAIFAVRKLPTEKKEKIYKSTNFLIQDKAVHDSYSPFRDQFRHQWIKIKAAEPIDVGGLVYIDNNGMAKECHLSKQHDHKIGVCMINNWPEAVVVSLYD